MLKLNFDVPKKFGAVVIMGLLVGLLAITAVACGSDDEEEAAAPAAPVQPDATLPQGDTAPMTQEGRIQMLDMVRKALLVSPTDLKDSEKMELGTAATHENVETKKQIIERIFSRLDATGTTDLNAEEPGEEF